MAGFIVLDEEGAAPTVQTIAEQSAEIAAEIVAFVDIPVP